MLRDYTVALLLDHRHQKCINNLLSAVNLCTFSTYIFEFYVLILLAVPKITATEATPNPRIGESFFLECSVDGIPDPTIVWVKEGFPLNTNNFPMVSLLSRPKASRIVVTKATGIEYSGMYICIASNDAGSVSSSFLIKLQGQQYDY